MSQIPRAERIAALLRAHFGPAEVTITDDSARHAGHAGAAPGGETHYTVKVVSRAFAGMNRVARQRAANAALAHEFKTGLHALSMQLQTPEETG
jgi:BolA protein